MTQYNNGSPFKTMVDTNKDGIYDLVFVYKNGSLWYGRKFYEKTLKGKESQVGEVYFKFGYPSVGESLVNTKMTKLKFQENAKKNEC